MKPCASFALLGEDSEAWIRRREPAMDWMMKCRYARCALETLRLGHNLDRTCWLASLSAYLHRSVMWFVVKDNIWALGRLYKNGETREVMRSIEALTLTLTLMELMRDKIQNVEREYLSSQDD